VKYDATFYARHPRLFPARFFSTMHGQLTRKAINGYLMTDKKKFIVF
jgi:hypothetical protein